jgi:hypothetical protein
MATIDIALPDDLMEALMPPACVSLELPQPEISELTLPIGGSLQGIADITQGIPTQCSMNFSLMVQIAPIMASMQCLLKILTFFGDLINAPSNPAQFIQAFLDGLSALEECTNMVLPLGMFCFVRDLLLLIARTLLCAVQALESVLALLSGLELQIGLAEQAGNADLLAALQCAQENAGIAAAGTMQSLQPITVLLKLAAPFMKIAKVNLDVSIPSALPTGDLKAMQTMLADLAKIGQIIEEAAELIPCPS